MDAAPERKLAAILSADVAGYGLLMGADEAATLALLKTYRDAIAAHVSRSRGRIVGTAGDSVLAEFSSVVNAVECAVKIQRELAERNATLPEPRRMRFRIGINLGDVLVEGGDLFGEGVNIAARLQSLAEPGGILISGPVFDQVRTKLALGFDYLGPQAVKNVAEEVPAYRVLIEGDAPADASRIGVEPAAVRQNPGGRAPNPARASPLPRSAGAPESAAPPAASRSPDRRLHRRAAVAGTLIAFLFAINMLTWHGYPWFLWPTLGILLLFALRTIGSVWR
jgi:adenylate cyclase